MRVLIVGGGISGLATAAFLKDFSAEVDIIEKCTDWSHHGYLIGLWDNGRDILGKIGLAEKLDAAGQRVRVNSLRDGSGRVIRDYSLRSLYSEFGGAVTIIGRKELHGWLLDIVGERAVRMGRSLSAIGNAEGTPVARFDDGSELEYDVIIGADGVRSKTREILFGADLQKFTDWRAWYVWVDNAYDVPATIVEYIEPNEYITTFSAGGKTLATLIAPADHAIWDTEEGRISRLKALFKDEAYLVPDAFEKVRNADVMPSDLADVDLPNTVYGSVALIGDAAHCYGPLAGLGTSMALEDAYTVAAELMRPGAAEDIPKALVAYHEHRKHRRDITRRLNRNIRRGALVRSNRFYKLVMAIARFIPDGIISNDYRKLLREEL